MPFPSHAIATHFAVALPMAMLLCDTVAAWRWHNPAWQQRAWTLHSWSLPAAYLAYYTGLQRTDALSAGSAVQGWAQQYQSHSELAQIFLAVLVVAFALRSAAYITLPNLSTGKGSQFQRKLAAPLGPRRWFLLGLSLLCVANLVAAGDAGGELLYRFGIVTAP